MVPFLLKKALRGLAILGSVTLVTFLLVHAIPGSPWNNQLNLAQAAPGAGLDAAAQRELNRRFGLDLPLWRQFTRYLIGDVEPQGGFFCGAICGNLGPSLRQRGRSVLAILFEPPEGQGGWESRFGYSLRLVLLGSVLTVGLGLPLGVLGAVRASSALGRALSAGLAALVSVPNFVLGLLVIMVFASWLKLINVLPDWDDARQWLIPALVLAVMPLASLARVTRAAVLNILNEDYVRTARAKGLTRARVLWVHVLRNALVPILAFLGPALIEMFTGLLVVENLFAFPGFGREYWRAVLALDYPLILGVTLLYASGIVLVTTMLEAAGELLDPRLRPPPAHREAP